MDGTRGLIFKNPAVKVERFYEIEKLKIDKIDAIHNQTKFQKAQTSDGHYLEIAANMASEHELDFVENCGAEGVGLFRTEMLYFGAENVPNEEEQFQVYSKVAIGLKNKPIIFRTFDVGGDKPLPSMKLPKEENPFLGQRGIRIYLQNKDLIENQIRALLKASALNSNLKIMVPMVSCLEEIREFKFLVNKLKIELDELGISLNKKIEVGMMIEVPSTVFILSLIFFSSSSFIICLYD